MSDKKPETPYGTLVLRKFVGGTVGGILQAICSHPFDTIKSRVQQGVYPSLGKCITETFKREGPVGFYRGVTPPLINGGFYNSFLFSINQSMINLVTPADHNPKDPLPLWVTASAGLLTSPFICVIITPLELAKVRLQVQPQGKDRLYTGLGDCIVKTVRNEGIFAMWRGYLPTLGTRFVGLPFYFSGYHVAKHYVDDNFSTIGPDGTKVAPKWAPLFGGTMAGFSFWCSCYPFDVLKTMSQASQGKSLIELAKEINAKHGIKGFYRGFSACLLRSTPANASVWFGIETTTKFMADNGW